MATFTKISDDETPSISVNVKHQIAKIDDNVYSGFTEHIGRCIYGGIYDHGNKLSDENGFRTDVLDALRELNIPVVRYPGGNFVATYHWEDGVGPKEQRPKRQELAWLTTESNEFGTDEFMKWCEVLGTEGFMSLNMGTGTLDEALAWLEYCNSDADTHYANLRRKNGREKPYNIKYWALGNEVWGPWQVAQETAADYAKKAKQWGKALKYLDPTIKLILCGQTGTTAWDYHVIKECINWEPLGFRAGSQTCIIDMVSIHIYTADAEHYRNVTAPLSAERAIQVTASLIDLARIENGVPSHAPRQTICFDEWNVWDPLRAVPEDGAEESYTLSDALAVAVWMNVFIRQAAFVGMANIAQSVNVISPLMTTPNSIIKQTTWYTYLLYAKFMRGHTVAVNVRSGEYAGDTNPEWLKGVAQIPWLDVSCAVDKEGFCALAVVNIHEEKGWEADLELGFGEEETVVETYTVTGDNVRVGNMGGKEEVGIQEGKWNGKGKFEFKKHSFTLLRWRV